MRIVCPNCSAHYDVADNAIPPGGREVQCTNCEHAWMQEPALVLSDMAPATPEEEPAYFRSMRSNAKAEARSEKPQESVLDILRSEAALSGALDAEETSSTPVTPPPSAEAPTPQAPPEEAPAAPEMTFAERAPLPEDDAPINTEPPAEATVAPQDEPTPEQEPKPAVRNLAAEAGAIAASLNGLRGGSADAADTDAPEPEAPPAATTSDADTAPEAAPAATDAIPNLPPLRRPSEFRKPADTPAEPTAAEADAGDSPFKKFGSRPAAEDVPKPDAPAATPQVDPPADGPSLEQLGFKRPKAQPDAAQDSAAGAQAPQDPPVVPDLPKTKSKSGRDVFADVDKLGSTLEEEAEREALKAEAERAAEAEKAALDENDNIIIGGGRQRGQMFWTGFWAACILVVLFTGIYYFSDLIAQNVPFAAGSIENFSGYVDSGRMALQDMYVSGGEPGLSNFSNNLMDTLLGRDG